LSSHVVFVAGACPRSTDRFMIRTTIAA
jgi:hypothetical protein